MQPKTNHFIKRISISLSIILLLTTILPHITMAEETISESTIISQPQDPDDTISDNNDISHEEEIEEIPNNEEQPISDNTTPTQDTEVTIPATISVNTIMSQTQATTENSPAIVPGETAQVDRVSMNGITFIFDKQYTVGKFVNGDYWVYTNSNDKLIIIGITPDYNSTTKSNGWEINPTVTGGQGFVGDNTGSPSISFNESLIPKKNLISTNSIMVRGTKSIVKTISTGGEHPSISAAAILTTVNSIPQNNGANTFRPAYTGTNKTIYTTDMIKADLLPSTYDSVDRTPTIDSLTQAFSTFKLEHKTGEIGRVLRHQDSADERKAYNKAITAAPLRLMMKDSIEDKMPLLIQYLQYGIDKTWIAINGQELLKSEGAEPLHLLPAAFASVLLDCKNGKKALSNAECFTGTKWFTQNSDGFTLFGNSSQAMIDPYGYIDGGVPSKESNQAIMSEAQKGEILATHLMPALKDAWPKKEWDKMRSYVDRWEYFGVWTLPDDAPGGSRYAIANGTHGTLADDNNPYHSDFTDAMWDAYRTTAIDADKTPPYAAIINVSDNSIMEGTKVIQTTAYGIHEIASVQYYLDYEPLGEPVTEAQVANPHIYELSVDFSTIVSGNHILHVTVTDQKGNTYKSKEIDFSSKSNVQPSGLIPIIDVRPGTNVKVNEEVFFTAEKTSYTDTKKCNRAKFTWDFGDGYALKNDGFMDAHGNSVIHYYMKPGTYTVTLTVSIYSGADGNNLPIGDVIAKRKEQVTIKVTGEAPLEGYELLHAPFTSRIAQFITATIPETFTADAANSMKVTLTGKTSETNITLFNKSALSTEEKFLVDYSNLPADEYTLSAQIYDGSGNAVTGGLWEEYFNKSYNGIPRVGINEWNAICVEGEPYFPVTPFMLNVDTFKKYEGAINTTYTVGYYNETPNHNHTPEIWMDYLDECAKNDWMAIGPGRGDYTLGIGRNKNISRMQDFVDMAKQDPALLGWEWCDEPNLGGRSMMTPVPVLASWNYATHEMDDQHPLAVNMVCDNGQTNYHYAYENSPQFTGRHFHFADIIQFDHYPMNARWHAYLYNKDEGIMALWVKYFDWIQEYSGNMLPNGAFIEVCAIHAEDGKPKPTRSQVLMEAWLAVVHGMKMVNWFPYFDYGSIQYDAMQEFMAGIDTFDQIILGPDLPEEEWVTDDSNVRNNRVDTMTKKDGDDIYLFTVRLTEPVPTKNEPKSLAAYDENKIITTTFTVPGITNGNAYVMSESGDVEEIITIMEGQFSDTYGKEEYRIYKITDGNSDQDEVPSAPKNLKAEVLSENSIYLSWDASTDNSGIDKYEIYMDDKLAATVSENVVSYTFTDLTPSTEYCFYVKAVDRANNHSVASNTVVVVTLLGYPDGLWCTQVTDQSFTGKAIKPEITVYDKNRKLRPGKDYSISYKNHIKSYTLGTSDTGFSKKSAPTIIVRGKGNYSGKETVYFKILPQDINDASVNHIALVQNKKIQKPIPIIKWKGKKLVNKKDFTLSYPDITEGAYKAPGTYKIIITGIGNYTLSREIAVRIIDKAATTMIGKTKVNKIQSIAYTGYEHKPRPTIKMGNKTLNYTVDYDLKWENNKEIGTATIIITGKGSYAGTKRVTFKITGTAMSKVKLDTETLKGTAKNPIYYTGSEIEQNCTLKYSYKDTTAKTPKIIARQLKRDTDYTVRYKNNIKAGTATVIFSGIGKYYGTIKKTFKISPYAIDGEKIKVSFTNRKISYEKGGAKPKPTVTFDGKVLTEGVDYTLSYQNNTKANNAKKTPIVKIKGKANFTGTRSERFLISTKELKNAKLIATDKSYSVKKNNHVTKLTIQDTNGKTLKVGTDYNKQYAYTYENDTTLKDGTIRAAGDVVVAADIIPAETILRVTVQGKGNYTGTASTTYRITKASIAKADIKVTSQTYSGEEIELDKSDIKIKVNGTQLENGDYKIIRYANNIKKGKASVVFQGVGNYGGIRTVKFTIKSKGFIWWWKH